MNLYNYYYSISQYNYCNLIQLISLYDKIYRQNTEVNIDTVAIVVKYLVNI